MYQTEIAGINSHRTKTINRLALEISNKRKASSDLANNVRAEQIEFIKPQNAYNTALSFGLSETKN